MAGGTARADAEGENLLRTRDDISFSFIVWPEQGAPGQILEGEDRDSLLVEALSLVRPDGLIAERRPNELVRIYPDPFSARDAPNKVGREVV